MLWSSSESVRLHRATTSPVLPSFMQDARHADEGLDALRVVLQHPVELGLGFLRAAELGVRTAEHQQRLGHVGVFLERRLQRARGGGMVLAQDHLARLLDALEDAQLVLGVGERRLSAGRPRRDRRAHVPERGQPLDRLAVEVRGLRSGRILAGLGHEPLEPRAEIGSPRRDCGRRRSSPRPGPWRGRRARGAAPGSACSASSAGCGARSIRTGDSASSTRNRRSSRPGSSGGTGPEAASDPAPSARCRCR